MSLTNLMKSIFCLFFKTLPNNLTHPSLPRGKLYDTPGLISGNHLYPALTAAEIMHIIPKKKVKPVTYRMTTGKVSDDGVFVVNPIFSFFNFFLLLDNIFRRSCSN